MSDGNNTFGIDMGGGQNSNGIVRTFTEEEKKTGGEQPDGVVKKNNTTNGSSGGIVNIVIGAAFGGGGGISSILADKLRDMLTNYVNPFSVEDISGTVQTNINSTLYINTINDFGDFTPTVNTNQSEWNDEQLISSFALSTLGVVNRGLLLYLDNEDLKVQVTIIADQIRNELAPKLITQNTGIMIDITASASIDLRYVFYVEKYGPPIGGIFDPIKLAEFV
tara:strand:+ start:50 stop:715 length:666 start_codon:yes stop_codon:yes gene_type:complete